MPLSSTNSTVPTSCVYPDRVSVNFQYQLSRTVTFERVREALQTLAPFRPVRRRRGLCGDLHVPAMDVTFQVGIYYRAPSAPLSVYVSINPLTYLHRRRDDYEPERSQRREDNWLH